MEMVKDKKTKTKGKSFFTVKGFVSAGVHKTIVGALGAVVALGGTYAGYEVYKQYQGVGANFDGRYHELVRVVDGDTIVVRTGLKVLNTEVASESDVKVRLLGIDAPENGQCFAEEAREALLQKLDSAKFITVKDEEPVDENERLLRHVFVINDDPREGARLVEEELLREGFVFARLDSKNSMYDRRYAAAEREARFASAGLWGACEKEVEARVASDTRLQNNLREMETAEHKKGCDIKGNISTKGAGKVYLLPKCPNYNVVIVDARKGEAYFCSEEEAKRAGFVKSESCENTF